MRTLLTLLLSAAPLAAAAEPNEAGYAIVVSQATEQQEAWREVVAALQEKHAQRAVQTLVYQQQPAEVLPELQGSHPRYTCFVARPDEATREFVAQVHELTRQYDEDPYTDTRWGILTGYDAANALAIARQAEPLVVRRVAAGTRVALEMVPEGVWYCELVKNRMVKKEAGGEPQMLTGPDDTTRALAAALCEYQADLFVTSGHATERDWQIGYRYRNGSFTSQAGQLYGQTSSGERFPIRSEHARVYLPVGNCLMGHIDGPDAMALAWMNSGGVRQMIGYTVPTWFGYAGWGCLDYFVEQPGRYTLVEAFLANQHALIHALGRGGAQERGLRFDRNVVALYGDPGWEARLANGPCAFDQTLAVEGDVFTFAIQPNRGEESFAPICTNGSQRGGRPFVAMLPHRIEPGRVQVLEGADLEPVIADDFLMVPHPGRSDPDRSYRVVFRAPAAASQPAEEDSPATAAESITKRFVPPVAGVDLEQALNFTDSEGLDLAWFYRSFTYPRVFYRAGSRPYLEKIVWEQTKPEATAEERLLACVDYVATHMPHYIQLGYNGAADRGLSEEDLLRSGHGWCNEQARVLVALTQIAGLPSRLVFAHSRVGKIAHVVTEVYVEDKWVLVDQTEGLVFRRPDGTPLNVLDFRRDEAVWREANALYKAQHARNRELAKDKAFWDSGHGIARRERPLELFECVGYHNYFIH